MGYFSTVSQRLVKEMGASAAQQHLSKSLFPVVIGNNDIIGYSDANSDAAKKYTPQQYVTLMLSNLKELLKVTKLTIHPKSLSEFEHEQVHS